MADGEHAALDDVRAIIRHITSLTHETNVDLGKAISMSPALVGRRQSSQSKWSVDELARVAAHWGLDLWCLFTDVDRVMHELPQDRVTELRAAKGLAPLHFKPPMPVAA
ncbi:hypothetical protein [Streptomyces roseolus]|uniref:hypothetical protein n=1 Tax=Streptomyces roseolus TaxID=67358 RepID=UPI0037BA071B